MPILRRAIGGPGSDTRSAQPAQPSPGLFDPPTLPVLSDVRRSRSRACSGEPHCSRVRSWVLANG